MAKSRRDWQRLPEGSAERVVQHALWAESRGRAPSMQFQGANNPKDALRQATLLCQRPPEGSAERVVQHALWAESRGRAPSMQFQGAYNPKDALHQATLLSSEPKPKQLMYVWNYLQCVPAALYGDKHFGRENYVVIVSPNARDNALANGGMVYHCF